MYDEEMAQSSRKMIMVCVWVHLIMARVFFANWPYKNNDEEASCSLFECSPAHNTTTGSGEPGAWTDDQEGVVEVYEVTGILIFFIGLIVIFFKKIKKGCFRLFCKSVDEVGEASTVPFRNLTGVSAYVPNIRRTTLINPMVGGFVACCFAD